MILRWMDGKPGADLQCWQSCRTVCRDAENGGVMFADYDANAVEPIWAVTLRLAVCVCSCCFAYLGLGAV